jgi:predicted ATPase
MQREAEVLWLTGQADPIQHEPLHAFAYLLRAYFEQRRDQAAAENSARFDTHYAALLAGAESSLLDDLRLFRPFVEALVGLHVERARSPEMDKKLRVDNAILGIRAVIRALCHQRPLMLQLEDAQWLAPSSIRTVQLLTATLDDAPLAILLTSRYRDDGTPVTIETWGSVPMYATDLGRLSDTAVQSVVESVLGPRVTEKLAAFVRAKAEGNPFFTEQLALDLHERGILCQQDGAWDLPLDVVAEVPSGVNAVLIARLDRLVAPVKAVVQTAVVLGREFEEPVLARMQREDQRPCIGLAEREGIWSPLDAVRYLFRHALLRDAAYDMQVQDRLKPLHRLAAETIEGLYPNDTTGKAWRSDEKLATAPESPPACTIWASSRCCRMTTHRQKRTIGKV